MFFCQNHLTQMSRQPILKWKPEPQQTTHITYEKVDIFLQEIVTNIDPTLNDVKQITTLAPACMHALLVIPSSRSGFKRSDGTKKSVYTMPRDWATWHEKERWATVS